MGGAAGPAAGERRQTLEPLLRTNPARADDVDLDEVSLTSGCSSADLIAIAREAALTAAAHGRGGGRRGCLRQTPSCRWPISWRRSRWVRRSGGGGHVMPVEAVAWSEIGGLDEVKRQLRRAVEWPLNHADAFGRLGVTPPTGVLLHGPPGCSKTTLARAAAGGAGATFVPVGRAGVLAVRGRGRARAARLLHARPLVRAVDPLPRRARGDRRQARVWRRRRRRRRRRKRRRGAGCACCRRCSTSSTASSRSPRVLDRRRPTALTCSTPTSALASTSRLVSAARRGRTPRGAQGARAQAALAPTSTCRPRRAHRRLERTPIQLLLSQPRGGDALRCARASAQCEVSGAD